MTPMFAILSLWPSGGAVASRRRWVERVPARSVAAAQPSRELETELASTDGFIDALVDLPLESWLAIGRDLVADRNGLSVRQDAWADVEAAITRRDLGMTVWSVRDALDTAAFLASRHASGWSREKRCAFAAAHGAAEAAALSVLVRADIPAESLRALCGPFATSLELELF